MLACQWKARTEPPVTAIPSSAGSEPAGLQDLTEVVLIVLKSALEDGMGTLCFPCHKQSELQPESKLVK